jgi:hypothetical protein
MHSFTLQLHIFFQVLLCSRIKTFPVCSNNRGKDLQNSKVGQISKQRFCKSFSDQKSKENRKEKRKKIGK